MATSNPAVPPEIPPAWLVKAREFDGLHEKHGTGPELVKTFFQATGFKGGDAADAWCSAFVCHVFELCDLPHPRSASAQRWLNWGYPLLRPRLGCITVFRRPDKKAQASDPDTWNHGNGHVALWLKTEGSYQHVYGGNQHNRVCAKPYQTADWLAWRWPHPPEIVMALQDRKAAAKAKPRR